MPLYVPEKETTAALSDSASEAGTIFRAAFCTCAKSPGVRWRSSNRKTTNRCGIGDGGEAGTGEVDVVPGVGGPASTACDSLAAGDRVSRVKPEMALSLSLSKT